MRFKILLTTAAVFGCLAVTAQKREASKLPQTKGPILGFAFNFTDYAGTFPKLGKLYPSVSAVYWQGIKPKLDISLRSNFSFVSKGSYIAFYPEFEASGHLKAFSDDHPFNPFLSGGVGVGKYGSAVVPYLPLGVGLQVNMSGQAYLFLQANYRVSSRPSKRESNTFFSLGLGVPLKFNHKAKETTKETAKEKRPRKVFADKDADGIADEKDKCPDVAGLAKFAGCPDKDGDGIPDSRDQCPDVFGLVKYKGCPVPDRDGDGVNDEEDRCPTVAGVAKYAGCPAPDKDGDGVTDDEDKCPTVSGPRSNQGCPEIRQEVKKRLEFATRAIQFETGKAVIKAQSFTLLDEIVGILKEYTDYNMEIHGHTDNIGSAESNMILSKERASAVKTYFVSKGIDVERLESEGYGDTQPKSDNKTAAGRADNRRVELNMKLR